MDLFRRSDLQALIRKDSPVCVSIFLPTRRTGPEMRENGVRLKNLLNEAEEKLIDSGMRTPDARELLDPAWELYRDGEFQRHLSDGLAVFLAPGVFHYFRVPLSFDSTVVVNKRFYVKPMLPLLEAEGTFFILACSQKQSRFLRGNRFEVREIELESLPRSIGEALRIDEYQESAQPSAHGAATTGNRGQANFLGRGASDADLRKNEEILQYFHRIDAALREFLRDARDPLVFVGVDYLFPIYRHANSYNYLLDEPVAINPDGLSEKQLHEKAWPIVESYLMRKKREALERYANSPRDLVMHDLAPLVRSARQGAIDTLFVAKDRQIPGRVDPDTGALVDDAAAQGDDILDSLITYSLLTSATVYVLPQASMPNGYPAAALLRYPVEPAVHEAWSATV